MNILREVKDIARLEKILSVLVKYELGYLVDKLKLKHIIPVHLRIQRKNFEEKVTEPKVLMKVCEELGGAFIKLGQLLSLRPDLIPDEYCREFKKLQDNVKPFSGEEAEEIVKKEIQKIPYFNKKPIASGSIAQVHEAVLPNSKKVVIKVQRPDAEEKFERDIDILYYLAKLFKTRYHVKTIDPVDIVDEFKKYTEEEFDFIREAKNIEKFYKNFENDPYVKIPAPYWDFTSQKVLTMEYLHGVNIQHIKKIGSNYKRRKEIAKRVTEMVFKQIFVHGFFHADPHPGNIFIMKNDVIGLLDYGIVGRMTEDMRKAYMMLISGIVYNDSDGMATALLKLHFSKKSKVNMEKLKEGLSELTEEYFDISLEKMDLGLMLHKIHQIARSNHMKLPSDFVLLGKSLITVEGFCVELDPKFNLVKTLKPFVDKLKKKEFDPKSLFKKTLYNLTKFKEFLTDLPDKTSDISESLRDVDEGIEKIDGDIKALNSNVSRSVDIIALIMLTVGFLLASVMMVRFGEPFMFNIPLLSLIGFFIAAVFFLVLMYSLLRKIR